MCTFDPSEATVAVGIALSWAATQRLGAAMALNLVTSGPVIDRRHQMRVRASRALGAGLMAAAAVATIPLFWLSTLLFVRFVEWVVSFEPPPTLPDALAIQTNRTLQIAVWVGSVAVFVVGLKHGRRLLATGRRHVLFLRRFGFTPATQAVTIATTRLGADWRSVTLDDQQTTPVGTGTGIRIAASIFHRTTRLLLLLLPLTFLLAYVVWLVLTAALDSPTEFESEAVTKVVVLFALISPAFVFLGRELARARRHNTSARLEIRDDGDIVARVAAADAAVRDAFGPRMLVVDVMDSVLWRRVVAAFAANATVALIDVSEPSDHVLWEIELLSTTVPRPCVFVAERSRAQVLATATDPRTARLHDLIAGRPVLTYRADATAEFTTALRGLLDQAVTIAPPAPRATTPVPLDEEAAGPDEASVRATLGRLAADIVAHYAAQRPKRSRKSRMIYPSNTTAIDRYDDGTRRETTTFTDPWVDGPLAPRDRWEVGDHETRLILPKRIVDRYGRTVALVTIANRFGHTRWELHLRTPGYAFLKEVTTTEYRWADDQPITRSETKQTPFDTYRLPWNEPIARDAASVAAVARIVADLERHFPARSNAP